MGLEAPYSLPGAVLPDPIRSCNEIHTVNCTTWAWLRLTHVREVHTIYSPHNPKLAIMSEPLMLQVLTIRNITTLGKMYIEGRFLTLAEYIQKGHLTPLDIFMYSRRRGSIK